MGLVTNATSYDSGEEDDEGAHDAENEGAVCIL